MLADRPPSLWHEFIVDAMWRFGVAASVVADQLGALSLALGGMCLVSGRAAALSCPGRCEGCVYTAGVVCSDAACKSVVNHDSASPSLSVPSPSSTKSTTPRSSCDGTLETGDPLALHSLIINGVPQCGTKLLAKGKSHDSKLKCRFQVRDFSDGFM